MGFSSALQGRAAHEALIVRQDVELRLMETMKRSIQMKAKCDKEYAISLAAVAQQGLKIDRADDMQGSLITKSWRSYMDELDQQAKQFKTNAELLEVVCEKISHLSQDKRKARKAYQEEHAKIAARLNHLTDEVVRKKSEYQKHLEGYKALRTRFEEHYIKSGRGGRKLDDVRDKYQKACRKLHLTHNEYVLSITEAIEVEKDFRTVLLPGLLEHQQSVQESFILLWRNILQEASQHGDLTSDKFREIQKRIDTVINNINPSEEYKEFTAKHKTSPTAPLVFQFDETLIEDIPGKLQASTLTVDNLTVDWLRSRLLDLEMAVKDCQEKQLKMIEHVNGGSPIANGSLSSNGNSSNGIQSNKDSQNRQSKDLNALRCQEKQKQKLVDMIKCALNEVGCEELPSGCDDHLTLDQNFIENGFNNDQQASSTSSNSNNVSIMNELMRRGGVLTLLRGPFKRKSTPQPTTPTARARTQRLIKLQPRSQSLGSLSVNTSPAKYETITNPLRMAASVDRGWAQQHRQDPDASPTDGEGGGLVALPRLRRAPNSMLCVIEEPVLSINYPPSRTNQDCAPAALRSADAGRDTNTNNNNNNSKNNTNTNTNNIANSNTNDIINNNNNIYADLELDWAGSGPGFVDSSRIPGDDLESVTSGDVPPPTPQLSAEELLRRRQMHVKIEINREDSERSGRGGEGNGSKDQQSKEEVAKEEPMKSSIDAHLDRIDELNRALDDRLKRQLPRLSAHLTGAEFDAIESTSLEEEAGGGGSKRTSSGSESQAHVSRKDGHLTNGNSNNNNGNNTNNNNNNSNGKKRSMSFSHKSINAILSNIKEFSRSPLARMHRHHPHSQPPPCGHALVEVNELIDDVADLTIDSSKSEREATTMEFKDTVNNNHSTNSINSQHSSNDNYNNSNHNNDNNSSNSSSNDNNSNNTNSINNNSNHTSNNFNTNSDSINNNTSDPSEVPTTTLPSHHHNTNHKTNTSNNTNANNINNNSVNTNSTTAINQTSTHPPTTSKELSSPKPTTTMTTATNTSNTSTITTSTSSMSSSSSSKLRVFKVPKIQKKSKAIRNTFRSKLMNFQLRRSGTKLCKVCSKRRRIHPSKSVFDFAKEFHLADEEFCVCPTAGVKPSKGGAGSSHSSSGCVEEEDDRDEEEEENSDDVLSMKDHCYCVPSLATSMSLSTNRPLYEEEWFHGVLPREEVVRLLNNDGDFLVRETIRNEESQIVLSVCWNGHKHFIVQTTVDGHFRFEGPPFPSIQELIMHQYQSELPVTVKSGAILRRPICRERWELSNDDVVLLEKIGRGNFGDVYKAKLKSTKQDVAAKTCRMTLPDEQKRKFLQEGRILKQYDHPNIVKFIGICVQKQPIMIVMELVPGGSLLNYLRKNSNILTTRQQMGMCRDAAAGMRYLESKNCIHRDLAARNCLIDFENSVKISDFGMSREEEEYIVSDGMKQIPVKWTAPEALNFGKYTSLCDVWSYGILIWEIFSKGDTPYSGMSNSRARERIDTGYRMPAPENTPPEMYRLMLKCWAAEAESRPHFDEIYNVVDALIIRLDNSH